MADITMPKMGFDMTEGTIVRWIKKVGDQIKKGEPIAEIETDKVTIEIEAFAGGTLTQIVADEGSVVPVGATIAVLDGANGAPAGQPSAETATPAEAEPIPEPAATAPTTAGQRPIGEGGEASSSAAGQTESAAAAGGAPQGQQTATSDTPRQGYGSDTDAEAEAQGGPAPKPAEATGIGERMQPVGGGSNGEHVTASPVAKRLARENNISLGQLSGSGPAGRIVRRDVEAFLAGGGAQKAAPAQPAAAPAQAPQPAQAAAPAPAPTAQPAPQPAAERAGARREPLSRLRQTIARRMVQSKTTVPHFYVTVPVDMTGVMDLRKQLNAMEGVKISVNDMVVKACALTLRQFPVLNASFAEDSLDYHDQINISVAVATDNGLLAPAVTDVDKKSLGVIAEEIRDLAGRTRSGKATPDELQRGTFTVSNLGMFGQIESFIAIVNPPQAAILAVGTAIETPVVKDGQVTIAPIMHATISADHRVADGAVAAQFMQALKTVLESPMRLLI